MIEDILLAIIALLIVVAVAAGWKLHGANTDLALMTAQRDTLAARIAEADSARERNLATIADLTAANAANSSAAEDAQKRADDAAAALAIALDQLATAQKDSDRRNRETYANDTTAKQWGDEPVPRALADSLRTRTDGL